MQLKTRQTFAQGESFWRIVLSTGRSYCELDTVDDSVRGKRSLDWHLDVVATGDVARIAELWLHTPVGDVALKINEPRSAYVLNLAVMSALGRSFVAQVIGRVDNRENGTGVAFIWDAALQRVYKDEQTSVHDFAPWRPGIARIGAIALESVGVML